MTAGLPQLAAVDRLLLVRCARLDLDDAAVGEIAALLTRPLAWHDLVLFAEAHSIAPLLYHHLKRFEASGLIPQPSRQRLLKLSHRAGYRNRAFRGAFQELADILAAAGVPVIVPKGLSLLESVYGNLSLRPLIDLVLLVRAEDRERAAQAVAALGYVDTVAPALRRFNRWYSSHVHLVKRGAFDVHLLLQWDLLNRPATHALDIRRVWVDARPTDLAARATLVPSPVDLVLYLCLQAAKHGYLNVAAADVEDPASLVFAEWTNNRLIRFTDIFETIRHHRNILDWTLLTERAQVGGIESTVYAGLRWVSRLFGPVADPGVLERLGSPAPRRVRRWLFEALTFMPARPGAVTVKTGVATLALRARTFPRRRLLSTLDLVEFVFPRREEFWRRHRQLSRSPVLLVYVVHVGRSLGRCVEGTLGHLRWMAERWSRALMGRVAGRPRALPRPK